MDSALDAGRWRKLGLLSALYFVQGLPFGFQATALPVYLRTLGISVRTISLLGVLSLPWLLKLFWAPFVDRYGSPRIGRRKSWILPLQLALALASAAAAFVPVPSALGLLLALVFAFNLFAATQDIAVDGWAIDRLGPNELGVGNAAQVVGYKLGMLTGGGLLVWASQYIGWSGLFLAMAGLCLLVFGVTLFAREAPPRAAAAPATTWRALLQQWAEAVRLPGTAWLLSFVATYKLGEAMSDVLYKPFLVDAGIRPEQIGLWVGTWGMLASLLGSLAGGLLASRGSLINAVGITAALRVFPLFGRVWLANAGVTPSAFAAVTLSEEFFGGALTTAMFAFMMSRVDRRIGASHYTLFASIEVFGKLPAGPLGGELFDGAHWSYGEIFLLGALLSVAFLALVPLQRRQPALG
jgi:MFS transporter, PAT family, beta-lactamase induction signal transducer AmpG